MEDILTGNLNEQAASWLVLLDDERTPECELRFRHWLESSADHIQAFLEVTAIDRDLTAMDPERSIDLDALIAQIRSEDTSNIVRLQRAHGSPVAPAFKRPRRRWSIGAAAIITSLAVLYGTFAWRSATHSSSYATATGEQRALKLEDGSLVHLNTRSQVEVHFNKETREVRLLNGEALITAQRDANRPFRVLAGSAVVQVIGTQFNVYRHANSTTVSVIEGSVGIYEKDNARNGSPSPAKVFTAGETARIEDGGAVIEQSAVKIEKTIAWRQRQLDFDHTSLAEVVEQFNRYNQVQIRIADPAVRLRELEGVFNADQPQALLDFLSQERDLWFERADGEIVIHAR